MADATEKVTTEWNFDPSGGIRGINLAGTTLQAFQAMVEQVNRAMPGLPLDAQFKIASEGIKRATVNARELEVALKSVAAATMPLGGAVPPIITRDKVAELKVLASQLHQSQVVADQFTGTVNRMNMALLARSSGRIGDNGASFNRGLANISVTGRTAEEALKGSNRAANLMRGSLVTLAAQSLQTSSALGGLAQSALLFAGGSTAVIAVAATVLAAVKGWELYTREQRASAVATEENRKALRALQDQQKGPVVQTQEAFATQVAEVRRLERALAAVAAASRAAAADIGRVGSGVGLVEKAGTLSEAYQKQTRQTKDLAEANKELAAARRAVTQATTEAFNAAAAFQRQQQELVVGALAAAPALGTSTAATQQEARSHMQRLSAIIQDQNASLVERNDAAQQFNRLLEASQFWIREAEALQRGETEAIERSVIAATTFLEVLKQINATEAQAIAARKAAQASRLGQTTLTADIDRAFEGVRGRDDLVVEPQILAFKKLVEEIRRAKKETKELEQAQREARTEGERIADALLDVGTAAFGIADVGYSLGIIGEEAAQAISDVGNLADALAAVAASASTANIFGAITAGAGVIGGILGKSPEGEAHLELLRQNNERLADLRASLDDSLVGARGLGITSAQIAEIRNLGLTRDPRIAGASDSINEKLIQEQSEALAQHLAESGLTIEQWATGIEQLTGLDVLDDKGRIIAGTVEQAEEAIRLMAEAAREFSDTLDIITQRRDVEEKLGLTPDRSQLERERDRILAGLDLGAAEIPVAALDLDTEAGRAAYQEWLKQIYAMAAAGELTVEQLGKFANVDELLGDIGASADAVNEANEAAAQAAEDAAQAIRDMAAAAAQAAFAYLDALPGLLDLHSRLAGTSDDVITQFQNMVQALHGWAPALADSFANMNLNDPAVRDALRQRLLDYVNQIIGAGGTFPGFSPEATQALLDFIGRGADVLDTFNESVKDATQSMLNVPRGLNLALLQFQTQALRPRISLPDLPIQFFQPPGRKLGDALPFRGTDGATAPTIAQHFAGGMVFNFYQQPGESNQDLARRVRREFEQSNLAKTGDPLRSG